MRGGLINQNQCLFQEIYPLSSTSLRFLRFCYIFFCLFVFSPANSSRGLEKERKKRKDSKSSTSKLSEFHKIKNNTKPWRLRSMLSQKLKEGKIGDWMVKDGFPFLLYNLLSVFRLSLKRKTRIFPALKGKNESPWDLYRRTTMSIKKKRCLEVSLVLIFLVGFSLHLYIRFIHSLSEFLEEGGR